MMKRIGFETFVKNLYNKKSPIHNFLSSKNLYVVQDNLNIIPKKTNFSKDSIFSKKKRKERKIVSDSENINNFFSYNNKQDIKNLKYIYNNRVDTKFLLMNSYNNFFKTEEKNLYSFSNDDINNERNKKENNIFNNIKVNNSSRNFNNKLNIHLVKTQNDISSNNKKNLPLINKYELNNISIENNNKKKQKRLSKYNKIQKPKNKIYDLNFYIPNILQKNNINKYLNYEMNDYYIQKRGKVFK